MLFEIDWRITIDVKPLSTGLLWRNGSKEYGFTLLNGINPVENYIY
jgi:hypothetical protein